MKNILAILCVSLFSTVVTAADVATPEAVSVEQKTEVILKDLPPTSAGSSETITESIEIQNKLDSSKGEGMTKEASSK